MKFKKQLLVFAIIFVYMFCLSCNSDVVSMGEYGDTEVGIDGDTDIKTDGDEDGDEDGDIDIDIEKDSNTSGDDDIYTDGDEENLIQNTLSEFVGFSAAVGHVASSKYRLDFRFAPAILTVNSSNNKFKMKAAILVK